MNSWVRWLKASLAWWARLEVNSLNVLRLIMKCTIRFHWKKKEKSFCSAKAFQFSFNKNIGIFEILIPILCNHRESLLTPSHRFSWNFLSVFALTQKRKKSNGNPYFLLPVSMVTGFKIFDQKLNKNHWKWSIFAQLHLLKYIYLRLIINCSFKYCSGWNLQQACKTYSVFC